MVFELSISPDITIEQASAGAIPALACVWHEAWHAGHAHIDPEIAQGRPLSFYQSRMAGTADRIILARVGGEVVGFTGWEGDGIGQLFVLPAWHGCGIAPLLLSAAERALKQQGHKLIWLQCRIGKTRARAFYEKHGWHMAREEEADIGTLTARMPITIWRMEKRL